MTKKLFVQAITKYLAGVVLVGLLLFLPAGTLRYPNGWLLMGLLFLPMFIAGVVMMLRDPSLLEKRLNAKEREGEQKEIIRQSGVMFIAAFILAGLNFRFDWLKLLDFNVLVILVLMTLVAGFNEVGETLEQTCAREVMEEVGLHIKNLRYYADQIFSFLVMLAYPPLIIRRIHGEERLLKKELPGYEDYMERVKYRLIPFVW